MLACAKVFLNLRLCSVSSDCGFVCTEFEESKLLWYLLTYLLTPWNRVLPEKLAVSHLAKKFHPFYGTGGFITALTRGRHMSSWARPIQSMASRSHFLKIHFNIILPSTHRFSKWFLSLSFSRQNAVCNPPVSHTCHMPRPSPLFYHPNSTWWAVQTMKLLIM